jgi:hypothetical protein
MCENHPDQPFNGVHACNCGAAGTPCPVCHPSTPDERRGCRGASNPMSGEEDLRVVHGYVCNLAPISDWRRWQVIAM